MLPTQTGDPKTVGRAHVFAIASNGERSPQQPLSVTASTIAAQRAGAAFTVRVATASGGAGSAYTARINWGDATPLQQATVTAGEGGLATITSGHRYARRGDYRVAVTVDDGVTSTVTTTSVHVS